MANYACACGTIWATEGNRPRCPECRSELLFHNIGTIQMTQDEFNYWVAEEFVSEYTDEESLLTLQQEIDPEDYDIEIVEEEEEEGEEWW